MNTPNADVAATAASPSVTKRANDTESVDKDSKPEASPQSTKSGGSDKGDDLSNEKNDDDDANTDADGDVSIDQDGGMEEEIGDQGGEADVTSSRGEDEVMVDTPVEGTVNDGDTMEE